MSWDLCQGKFIVICIETPLSFNCSPFSVGFHGMPCHSSTLATYKSTLAPQKSLNGNLKKSKSVSVWFFTTLGLGKLDLTTKTILHFKEIVVINV